MQPATCRDARVTASLALDGELGDDLARAALRRHLAECDECASLVAGMSVTVELLRSSRPHPFRASLPARLPRERRRRWAWATVATVALLASTTSLPRADAPLAPAPAGQRAANVVPRLPVGQRSAGEDFAPVVVPSPTDAR